MMLRGNLFSVSPDGACSVHRVDWLVRRQWSAISFDMSRMVFPDGSDGFGQLGHVHVPLSPISLLWSDIGGIRAGPGVDGRIVRRVCWEACMAGGEGKRGSSGKVFVVAGMVVAAPLLTVVVVLLCLVILVVAILQSDYGLGTRCVTGSSSWVDWAVSVA